VAELPTVCVYLAGPLHGSGRTTENIHRVLKAAHRIRAAGMVPFIPHLFAFWDMVEPHEGDYWLSMDEAWLRKCDVLVRLTGVSPGSSKEEVWASEINLPIYYEGDGKKGVSELISAYAAGEIQPREPNHCAFDRFYCPRCDSLIPRYRVALHPASPQDPPWNTGFEWVGSCPECEGVRQKLTTDRE